MPAFSSSRWSATLDPPRELVNPILALTLCCVHNGVTLIWTLFIAASDRDETRNKKLTRPANLGQHMTRIEQQITSPKLPQFLIVSQSRELDHSSHGEDPRWRILC
jgi:hypothetical protein